MHCEHQTYRLSIVNIKTKIRFEIKMVIITTFFQHYNESTSDSSIYTLLGEIKEEQNKWKDYTIFLDWKTQKY